MDVSPRGLCCLPCQRGSRAHNDMKPLVRVAEMGGCGRVLRLALARPCPSCFSGPDLRGAT